MVATILSVVPTNTMEGKEGHCGGSDDDDDNRGSDVILHQSSYCQHR